MATLRSITEGSAIATPSLTASADTRNPEHLVFCEISQRKFTPGRRSQTARPAARRTKVPGRDNGAPGAV
ncbi:hypothetical protein DID88_003689 [Monilinia fructigena]|uniref:Uncharacterized protein n=1 Tax=Monilinia fructigena TaxID=38457 RepID=A0A395IUD8_9HELO|nr:hypothetical protein DID88_003689 [Monilinia fructigena]